MPSAARPHPDPVSSETTRATPSLVTPVVAPWSQEPKTPDSDPSPSDTAQALLLAWYQENKRDLPWRETTDPYAVLVSEVMSQQKQVLVDGVVKVQVERALLA